MNTYDVIVTREKGAWLAQVPTVPGASTFARSLPSLLTSIREVIVLMDDLPDDAAPEVTLTFDVEDRAVHEAGHLADERRDIAARERELQSATADAARRLTQAGYSVRDAAVMLHITPGRVSQLTNA
ncbi:MAG: type II toxin-antitoxin system HicB family antitoxin [Nostocoides sp.]